MKKLNYSFLLSWNWLLGDFIGFGVPLILYFGFGHIIAISIIPMCAGVFILNFIREIQYQKRIIRLTKTQKGIADE